MRVRVRLPERLRLQAARCLCAVVSGGDPARLHGFLAPGNQGLGLEACETCFFLCMASRRSKGSWTRALLRGPVSNSVGCVGRNVRLARGRRCAHLVRCGEALRRPRSAAWRPRELIAGRRSGRLRRPRHRLPARPASWLRCFVERRCVTPFADGWRWDHMTRRRRAIDAEAASPDFGCARGCPLDGERCISLLVLSRALTVADLCP